MRALYLCAIAVLAAGCAIGTPMNDRNAERLRPSRDAPGSPPTLDGAPPLIIAHRGASGYRPEHTLAAYGLAIDQGADVIEPDLVFTKDGALVARHDRHLSTTTDVAARPEFAARKRPDAAPATGAARADWWVEDFTLEEIKSLRAVQPRGGRPKDFDGRYQIPTFAEILALAAEKSAAVGRPVGVYPETKHPDYFAAIGLDFEKPLIEALEGFAAGPVFIQSFEPAILKRLKGRTNARLVQLVYEESPGAGPNIPLTEITSYADGVGAERALLLRPDFVAEARRLGLFVHSWTYRVDDPSPSDDGYAAAQGALRGPLTPRERGQIEIERAFLIGADGVFTDFPDIGVAARDSLGWPAAPR